MYAELRHQKFYEWTKKFTQFFGIQNEKTNNGEEEIP